MFYLKKSSQNKSGNTVTITTMTSIILAALILIFLKCSIYDGYYLKALAAFNRLHCQLNWMTCLVARWDIMVVPTLLLCVFSVSLLTGYICEKLKDHHSLQPHALYGLQALVSTWTYPVVQNFYMSMSALHIIMLN